MLSHRVIRGCRAASRFAAVIVALSVVDGFSDERSDLARRFESVVAPFLRTYCHGCHGSDQPEAKLDLTPYVSLDSVTRDFRHWQLIRSRLQAGDMPPADAGALPSGEERGRVLSWIAAVRSSEARRLAGDPGPVLPRRLSNAEYNYAIQDLTGQDLRPTADFPVDPANAAGFDNSGEALTMSPALLSKYLGAAKSVADHLVFLPDGIRFAPHPMVVYSDRDKYAVHRIVDFYQSRPTDPADYFFAAWLDRYRTELQLTHESPAQLAAREGISVKYFRTVRALLTGDDHDAGPVKTLRQRWRALPTPNSEASDVAEDVRQQCVELRDWVRDQRRELMVPVDDFRFEGLSRSCQPIILWKDRVIAANRRRGQLPEPDGTQDTEQLRQAIAEFCSVFPDTLYVTERGRMFESNGLDRALDPSKRTSGRLLSAGFHLMFGYFRDDRPLYDLILDEDEQRELDRMWTELNFISRAPIRQFSDFIYFERAEGPAWLRSPEFDFAREDTDITAQPKIAKLAERFVAKGEEVGVNAEALNEVRDWFAAIADQIRQLEDDLAASEARHRQSLLQLAERAWRRPLTTDERAELLDFYRAARRDVGLSHEEAVRDTLAMILISPHFCYRVAPPNTTSGIHDVSEHEMASRLSFFLWSGLPDDKLLRHAAAGDLQNPEVLRAQMQRMLKDPRTERFATEFGGQWLNFRRFRRHNAVDRDRFPEFDDDLREAMFAEPVRFLVDLIQRNGRVQELLAARHTFVNRELAEHYGIPWQGEDESAWIRVDRADRYGRGGLLPMSVFLTMNAPGLRTSPVKRGYWVVRRLVGEEIPPPPPDVPEIPADEADSGGLSVRDLLARHREVAGCAQCHRRFDSVGLVFEAYGPVGERRDVDLGGRPVDDSAVFPDGTQGRGVRDLSEYLLTRRQEELTDHLCRQMLAYALGRSLQLCDEMTIEQMKTRLRDADFRIHSLIETIVFSPQFQRVRAGSHPVIRP